MAMSEEHKKLGANSTKHGIFKASRDLYDVVQEMIISGRADLELEEQEEENEGPLREAAKAFRAAVKSCLCQQTWYDPEEHGDERGSCPVCNCDYTFFCDLHRDGEEGGYQ